MPDAGAFAGAFAGAVAGPVPALGPAVAAARLQDHNPTTPRSTSDVRDARMIQSSERDEKLNDRATALLVQMLTGPTSRYAL